MTGHVLRTCRAAGVDRIVVVVGHEADLVRKGLGSDVEYALQSEQRGTGDAILAAKTLLADWEGTILILAGDVPLIPAETLQRLLQHKGGTGAEVAMLTSYLDDPTGYGRIVRNAQGGVADIVEERDASPEQRAIKEWNPSIYAFSASALWEALAQVQPTNAQGEFYLTDTIRILAERGAHIEAVPASDSRDMLGVNNRVELAHADSILRGRILKQLMLSGVSITDPSCTYIEVDVNIGQDTRIEPNCYLYRGTNIGSDCQIGPDTSIARSTLGDGVVVSFSHLVESVLEDGVKVGPYANLRPGTHLGKRVKIGDFVEIKNAVLGEGVQVNHLSYIGDAEVGEATNIGAGTVTCNYDGFHKHRTTIGKHAFIGSHSTLVAPVQVGDGALVAAASPITRDVPPDALAIARCHATIKEEWAARYRQAKAEERKANQQK